MCASQWHSLFKASLEFTSKMKLFVALVLAVAAVHSQPTAEANPAPWYGYYGYGWPAYHYGYYGKRSADAEATGADEADAKPWLPHLGYGSYGDGYGYGKRSADAEPTAAAEADAKPWWYGSYGYGWPAYGYGYYGKRSADAEPTDWWKRYYGNYTLPILPK